MGNTGVIEKPKAFSMHCDGWKSLLKIFLKYLEATAAAEVGGSHPLHYLLFPGVANNGRVH